MTDIKNPARTAFIEVRTVNSGVHTKTLEICKQRSDPHAKAIEQRLLSIVDLVVAEGRYHMKCRIYFEREFGSGKPVMEENETLTRDEVFELMCEKLENLDTRFTIQSFSDGMKSYGVGIFDNQTIKSRLQEK